MTAPPQDRPAPPRDRPGPPQDRPPATTATPSYDPRHRGLRVAGAGLVGLAVLGISVGAVPEMVRDSEVQSFTLPEGTQELRIVSDVGDVDVRGVTAGGATGIEAEKHWSFREPEASVETAGGVTTVSMRCPGIATFGQCYADWTVAVPEDLAVVVRTSVGDVVASALTGDVDVNSAVGDVTVDASPATLDVTTSVGSVDAVLAEPADRVTVRTSVGDVDLTLPGDVTYDVRASSLDPADVQVQTSGSSEHDVTVESSIGSILVTGG